MGLNFLKKREKVSDVIFDKALKTSYSQCGEDLIIEYVFNLRNIQQPSYLDIGAHHPFFLSNTALFYKKGCRGINIDANPDLISLFYHERPEDINLNIGIGAEKGDLDFFIMNDLGLSTFSQKELQVLIDYGHTTKEIKKIKVETVEEILNAHYSGNCPDFLNIDVEGFDFEILQSINFEKFVPKIICVEAAEYSPVGAGKRRDDLIDFLQSKNYYEYANTNLNAIMVEKNFWFI